MPPFDRRHPETPRVAPAAGSPALPNPVTHPWGIRGLCEDLNHLRDTIHAANVRAGWWTDLATGEPKPRNVGEMLCLAHSEISEALEGHRKGLMDDKLPHRPMIEVEIADVFIRLFDLAGAMQLDIRGAIREKFEFNQGREDHKIETRMAAGGKVI